MFEKAKYTLSALYHLLLSGHALFAHSYRRNQKLDLVMFIGIVLALVIVQYGSWLTVFLSMSVTTD